MFSKLISIVTKRAVPTIMLVVVPLLFAGGVWVYSVIKENQHLESIVESYEVQISDLESSLEEEREQFQKTISNYDDVMSEYLEEITKNQQATNRLRGVVSRLSEQTESLGQCLNEQVPEELLNELWRDQ